MVNIHSYVYIYMPMHIYMYSHHPQSISHGTTIESIFNSTFQSSNVALEHTLQIEVLIRTPAIHMSFPIVMFHHWRLTIV